MSSTFDAQTGLDGVWTSTRRDDGTAQVRLFCFPYAGGGTALFYRWAQWLPPTVQVCPVELPGHGRRLREPAFRQIEPLVAAAAEGLRAQLDRPFAFFGHSLGAWVAFELARHLRQACGLMPFHLFVSANRAPHLPSRRRTTYNLPEAEFRRELQLLNGTPREILENEELMQLLLPTMRADFEMFECYSYRAAPPLSCPLTALGGCEDQEVDPAELEAWRTHTSAAFVLQFLPGDHFFVHTSQVEVLQIVRQAVLAETESEPCC